VTLLHAWINSIAISVIALASCVISYEIRHNRKRIEDLERQLHRKNQGAADEAEQRYRGHTWES
jgi:hypothetical protein